MARTDSKIDTPVTRGGSLPVRYQLVAREGHVLGPYETVQAAAARAAELWPHLEQDPDRTGAGWDIEECPKNP